MQIDEDYNNRSYDELSKELKTSITRAYTLIPLMYTRLTQVDGFSYKEAVRKLHNDHKDLPGFSHRNVHRCLPKDLPGIPRRVVPLRHKSSSTEQMKTTKLSVTKLSGVSGEQSDTGVDGVKLEPSACGNEHLAYEDLLIKNQELEEALEANSKFVSASALLGIEHTYVVPKETHHILIEAFKKSKNVCYVIFDCANNFAHAEADIDRMKTQSVASHD